MQTGQLQTSTILMHNQRYLKHVKVAMFHFYEKLAKPWTHAHKKIGTKIFWFLVLLLSRASDVQSVTADQKTPGFQERRCSASCQKGCSLFSWFPGRQCCSALCKRREVWLGVCKVRPDNNGSKHKSAMNEQNGSGRVMPFTKWKTENKERDWNYKV